MSAAASPDRDKLPDLIGPHQHYGHLAVYEWCTVLKGSARWQHTEKPSQHVSATWQSPIGPPQLGGSHHHTDLTCRSHQHATWQALTGPPQHLHATWQHSSNIPQHLVPHGSTTVTHLSTPVPHGSWSLVPHHSRLKHMAFTALCHLSIH
jgi:hypothetical protein